MNWISFLSGAVVTAFAFSLFSDTGITEDEDGVVEAESEVVVNDFANRHTILYCETCRKKKRHKEIETDLYQCARCKRHVDLRRVS